MICVCWTCGGVGDYLVGDERRAIECFGCQVSREVDEHMDRALFDETTKGRHNVKRSDSPEKDASDLRV